MVIVALCRLMLLHGKRGADAVLVHYCVPSCERRLHQLHVVYVVKQRLCLPLVVCPLAPSSV